MSIGGRKSVLGEHAKQVEDHKRWFWIWRQLHALFNCRNRDGVRDEWRVDMGYCLDRYTLPHQEDGL